MSEISKYEAQVKRMQGLCEEHDLYYRFIKDKYPMAFVIRPTQGMGEQLSMLEKAEDEGYTSPDAYMKWIFTDDGLRQIVDGGVFSITVTLRSKLESVMNKMIKYWLQFFFKDVIEKDSLRRGMMPVIDESEDNDTDGPDGENGAEDSGEDAGEDGEDGGEDDGEDGANEDLDERLIDEATKLVRVENKASVTLLQRRLNIGYSQAARIIDRLEEQGVVGPFNGADPREVLPFDAPNDEAV